MPVEEKKMARISESEISISYDGVPLSGDMGIRERLEFYRRLNGLPENDTGNQPACIIRGPEPG